MSYKAYGNIALAHLIARHLETVKLGDALSARDAVELAHLFDELQERVRVATSPHRREIER